MRWNDPAFEDQLKEGSACMWILALGIDQYDCLDPLSFASKDAQAIVEVLEGVTGNFPGARKLLHCDGADLGTRLSNVCSSLEKIRDEGEPNDIVIFTFSGHSEYDAPSQDLYICLADTDPEDLGNTGLSLSELHRYFDDAGIYRQVLVLDSCHSGHLVSQYGQRRPHPNSSLQRSDQIDLSQITEYVESLLVRQGSQMCSAQKSYGALLSCGAEQQSYELPEFKHGILSYLFIRELKRQTGLIKFSALCNTITESYLGFIKSLKNSRKYQQTRPIPFLLNPHDLILGESPESPELFKSKIREAKDTYLCRYRDEIQQLVPLNNRTFQLGAEARDRLKQIVKELELEGFEAQLRNEEQEIAYGYRRVLQDFEKAYQKEFFENSDLSSEGIWNLSSEGIKKFRVRFNNISIDGFHIDKHVADFIKHKVHQKHEEAIKFYREKYEKELENNHFLSISTWNELKKDVQNKLHLSDHVVAFIHVSVEEEYEKKLKEYKDFYIKLFLEEYLPFSEKTKKALERKQRSCALSDSAIGSLEKEIGNEYESKIFQPYKDLLKESFLREFGIYSDETKEKLRKFIDFFCIGQNAQKKVNIEVYREVEDNHIKSYSNESKIILIHDYPEISPKNRQKLESLQEKYRLGNVSVQSIEQRIVKKFEEEKVSPYKRLYERCKRYKDLSQEEQEDYSGRRSWFKTNSPNALNQIEQLISEELNEDVSNFTEELRSINCVRQIILSPSINFQTINFQNLNKTYNLGDKVAKDFILQVKQEVDSYEKFFIENIANVSSESRKAALLAERQKYERIFPQESLDLMKEEFKERYENRASYKRWYRNLRRRQIITDQEMTTLLMEPLLKGFNLSSDIAWQLQEEVDPEIHSEFEAYKEGYRVALKQNHFPLSLENFKKLRGEFSFQLGETVYETLEREVEKEKNLFSRTKANKKNASILRSLAKNTLLILVGFLGFLGLSAFLSKQEINIDHVISPISRQPTIQELLSKIEKDLQSQQQFLDNLDKNSNISLCQRKAKRLSNFYPLLSAELKSDLFDCWLLPSQKLSEKSHNIDAIDFMIENEIEGETQRGALLIPAYRPEAEKWILDVWLLNIERTFKTAFTKVQANLSESEQGQHSQSISDLQIAQNSIKIAQSAIDAIDKLLELEIYKNSHDNDNINNDFPDNLTQKKDEILNWIIDSRATIKKIVRQQCAIGNSERAEDVAKIIFDSAREVSEFMGKFCPATSSGSSQEQSLNSSAEDDVASSAPTHIQSNILRGSSSQESSSPKKLDQEGPTYQDRVLDPVPVPP